MNKFPGFNMDLRSWFIVMRAKFPVLHCSEAGRGIQRQTLMFQEKKSRATYGASSHNWNAGLDLFIMSPGLDLYDKTWFMTNLYPEIPEKFNWYGTPGSRFYEIAHIEVRDWKMLAASGHLKLVETPKTEIKRLA